MIPENGVDGVIPTVVIPVDLLPSLATLLLFLTMLFREGNKKMAMSPEIFARVHFFRAEDGGRKGPTSPKFFGCPFLMDGQKNDCRLVLSEVGSISPGQTIEVPIAFLAPNLVIERLKVGRKFELWEMGIIAEGEILKVLTPKGVAGN